MAINVFFEMFVFLHWLGAVQCSFLISRMASSQLCGVREKINNGCLKLARANSRSIIECARECSLFANCEGFGVDYDLNCYTVKQCREEVSSCIRGEETKRFKFFKLLSSPESCLNGGVRLLDKPQCKCFGGFVGLRCERYAVSCRELLNYGYEQQTRRKTYILPVNFSKPFLTHCAIHANVIRTDIAHQRANHPINNNRNWEEYESGFYSNQNNPNIVDFWLGLSKIYYLNSVLNLRNLRIEIAFNYEQSAVYFRYNDVIVAGPDQYYALSYSGVNTTRKGFSSYEQFKNCLFSTAPFSTPDKDNDMDENKHCAEEAKAGWWFSQCTPNPPCNPLGTPYETGREYVSPERMRFNDISIPNLTPPIFFRMYFEEEIDDK